jgi:hypothetical protein
VRGTSALHSVGVPRRAVLGCEPLTWVIDRTTSCAGASRTIAVMRRALVALSLTFPACLSGFSEIRVGRPDAAVDAARVDAVVPADAPGAASDAPDVPPAPDVPSAAMDAPDAAVLGDVAPGTDAAGVLDAGGQLADVVDVAREDHVDAGAPTDGADVFDAQCPMPLCNGVCVDTSSDRANCGRCGVVCPGRCQAGNCVRFVGVVPVDPLDRFARSTDPRTEWATMCNSLFPGSRVCRMADVRGLPLHGEICAAAWPMRPTSSPSRAVAALAEQPNPMATGDGRTGYVCAECVSGGAPLDAWGGCFQPHTIACCAP